MESRVPQARPAQQPTYVNRFGPEQTVQEPEPRPNDYRGYNAPVQQDYMPRDNGGPVPGSYGYSQPAYNRRDGGMGIADILAAGDCGDGEGVLEVHPDGYGFLRTNHYLPGKQDVYISNAQIRRFNLRTGDYVAGKTRPQREPDRYSAMLYITEVNGAAPEEVPTRPRFEDLTPIYPKRRISLTGKKDNDPLLRLMDVLCPIGFGQRAMLLCGPRVNRLDLLKSIGAAINRNHSKAQMMMLLVDERPEEVTDVKEAVKGEVIYATFDEHADNQVKVTEMTMERAMRMVEQKKDVIILADSLTRLSRASNAIAPQTARTLSGGLAAGALNKPKKFFGAARNTREGGSLTIITTVLCDTGSELDTAILQEFRGNSNMSCTLLRGKGGQPVIQAAECGTIHDEWLQPEEERKLAERLRAEISGMQPEEAMEKLLHDMAAHETNESWSTAEAGEAPTENE
jgi:transcription termination factor Rho